MTDCKVYASPKIYCSHHLKERQFFLFGCSFISVCDGASSTKPKKKDDIHSHEYNPSPVGIRRHQNRPLQKRKG